MEETITRFLKNISRVPSWNTTMSKKEIEYMFDKHDDTVFCNGHFRQIKVDAITSDLFKVYTIPF